MFNKSLSQHQALDPRAKSELLSQEPLQPDSQPHVGWLRRLKRKWTQPRLGQAEVPELFVPDGRLALLVLDGKPDRWFSPGRHQLSPAMPKVELRLIATDLLPAESLDRLDLLLDLPYERALLYVDGVLVAIVKPGHPSGSPSGAARSTPRWAVPALAAEQRTFHPARPDQDEDLLQDYSFV